MAQQSMGTQGGQQSSQGGQGSPVDNMTYNLISTLHTKLEGLTVYPKYIQDAQGDQATKDLYTKLMQTDQQQAQQILEQLKRHLAK